MLNKLGNPQDRDKFIPLLLAAFLSKDDTSLKLFVIASFKNFELYYKGACPLGGSDFLIEPTSGIFTCIFLLPSWRACNHVVKSPRADYAEEEVSGHLGLNPAKWDLK